MNALTKMNANTKVKYDVMNNLEAEIEARDEELANKINELKSTAVLFNGTVSTGDIVLSYPITNYNELIIGTGSSTTLMTIRITHLGFPTNFTVGTNFSVPTSSGVASLTVKDANTITINSTTLAIRRIVGKKV